MKDDIYTRKKARQGIAYVDILAWLLCLKRGMFENRLCMVHNSSMPPSGCKILPRGLRLASTKGCYQYLSL